jgi:hypothetical protein
MMEKKWEILLYNSENFGGIAHCKKHNVRCIVEIERKSEGIDLTYYIPRQEHFYTNLASGKCKSCYYFSIELELKNNCEVKALYCFRRGNKLRLTPVCKDNEGRINYLKPIEVKIKKEKIRYEK